MHRLTIWLIIKIFFGTMLTLCLPGLTLKAQLTLDSVQSIARKNYPLSRQQDLLEQTKNISIENLNKGYLPQFSINGQASYQSDVTEIRIPVPNFKMDPLSKDQYRLTADINQLIFDGGAIKHQVGIQTLSNKVDQQKLEVELYALEQRINDIFLGILLLDQQLLQLNLVHKDLESGLSRVKAQVENGVAFRSNYDMLKAEQLKIEQQIIELKANRLSLIQVLGLFLNQELQEETIFQSPVISLTAGELIQRPEINLFDHQSALVEKQKDLIDSKKMPRTSLFIQGGYGRPGLNMLNNSFDWFYIGGIRLNWSLFSFYTNKKDKQLVDLQRRMIDLQKETFVLNTNTQLKKQLATIKNVEELILTDIEIIKLRTSVKNSAKVQLENGVITAHDYLREVTAENLAKQQHITHQLQLVKAQLDYNTIIGK